MALGVASGGRRVDLRGCFNFRDVGRYPTNEGRRTRWRTLFRSDGLHHLTLDDRKNIAAFGLSSVIDLRTAQELAEQGPVQLGAATYHLPMVDVLADVAGRPHHVEPALIAEAYHSTLVTSVDTVREVFAILTDRSSYPAVVCCPSGVDRTGIVIAVVLGVIGVSENFLLTDFAASREATLRRIGRMRFEHPSAVRMDVDRVGPGLLGVVPEAIGLLLARLRCEHGALTGYAESIDMAGAVPYLRAALLGAR